MVHIAHCWWRRVAAILFITLVAAGCSDSTTGPEPPPQPTPDRIALSSDAVTLTYLGATATVIGEVRDTEGGLVSGAQVEWSSSQPSVATVVDGAIEAVGPGTAQIIASHGTLSASLDVSVDQQPSTLELLAGGGQAVPTGSPVPDPIRIRLLDAGGSPIAGYPLAVAPVSGDGSLTSTSIQTDAEGAAELPSWTLGPRVGPQSVLIEADDIRLIISVSAIASPATVAVPDAQILAAGHVHEEEATVDESQLVVILTDEGAFAHIPLMGDVPDLTVEGSARALRLWMAGVLGSDGEGPAGAGALPEYDPIIGIDVRALSNSTHRFRNDKSRAAALRLDGPNGQLERWLLPPRGSVFDVDLIGAFRGRSSLVSSLQSTEIDGEITGPTEVTGIGSVITGPFIAGSLPGAAWGAKRQQIQAGLDADRELFLAVNGFDIGHVSFELIRALVGVIPLECVEEFVAAILLEPALALAEGAFERMFEDLLIVGDPSGFLEDWVWSLTSALMACACDAVSASVCSVAGLVLDLLSVGALAIDLGIRSWDVLTTPSYQVAYLGLPPVHLPVPSIGRLRVGEPFEHVLEAEGGTGVYEWRLGPGALPPGVELDPTAGVLAGTPTGPGEFGVTIEARSGGLIGTLSLLLVVDGPGGDAEIEGSWQAVSIGGEPIPLLEDEWNNCETWLTELAWDFRGQGEFWLKAEEVVTCPSGVTTWMYVDSGTWERIGDDRVRVVLTHLRDFQDGELDWESTGREDVTILQTERIGEELHAWEAGFEDQRYRVVLERGSIDFPPLAPPASPALQGQSRPQRDRHSLLRLLGQARGGTP